MQEGKSFDYPEFPIAMFTVATDVSGGREGLAVEGVWGSMRYALYKQYLISV